LLRRLSPAFELVFAALAVFAAVPLWVVEHPPIQDLPQHLAAIRVLHDYGDPALAFEKYFTVDLWRTQYLAYYLAADLLAYPFGVELANVLLLSASIVGTPYAMRALMRALGRDERLAVAALPLTWNAHLILGFLNFVAALPLALFGLALAARLRQQWTRGRAIGLAVVTVVTFYTHVVPFGFLGLGSALLLCGDGLRETVKRWLLLGPAVLAMLVWTQTAPAGEATWSAVVGGSEGGGPQPQFMGWVEAIKQLPRWLTDVLRGTEDDRLLVVWGLLLLLAIGLGAGSWREETTVEEALQDRLARRAGILAPLAALGYFVTPASYDWIWPINARFPLLALVLLIPVLPVPRRWPGAALFVGFAVVSVLSFVQVNRSFQGFEQEVGRLEAALETIPKGERVAALVFDRGSREVKFAPFLHSAAWYQTKKGGAVMFTFADFPQSPFRFREDNRPPRVGPRWEWKPGQVDPRRDLAWYDWVLVRGGPGRIARQRDAYEPVFRSRRWSVWKRK
jgi:TRAP-type C4-dicarboxylate transport system permease small subunit